MQYYQLMRPETRMLEMAPTERLIGTIEDRLLALILRANRARMYDQLLDGANVDINRALYPVLSAASALAPARVSEIAKAVAINATTTSRHLTALEAKGLVSRTSSDADGRAALIELTPAGRRAIRELRAARTRIFTALLADFDDDDLERFGGYLDRLVEAFSEQARPDSSLID
jgi:DNA-binding MarR family transcriptional regulator